MVIMGSLMKETKEETISQLAARARAHVHIHIQIRHTRMHALFWQFLTHAVLHLTGCWSPGTWRDLHYIHIHKLVSHAHMQSCVCSCACTAPSVCSATLKPY